MPWSAGVTRRPCWKSVKGCIRCWMTLPAIIHLMAPDYEIRFANQKFRESFGSWQGSRCYEIMHGRNTPCEVCPPTEVLQTQKSQVREVTRDNGRIYQVYHYPFTELDGSPLILNMGIDITARKQAGSRP